MTAWRREEMLLRAPLKVDEGTRGSERWRDPSSSKQWPDIIDTLVSAHGGKLLHTDGQWCTNTSGGVESSRKVEHTRAEGSI